MRVIGYVLLVVSVALLAAAVTLAVLAPDQWLVATLVIAAALANMTSIALGLWWTR